MNELENKVALVTGGGRGLGAAICKALVNRGARVVVADIQEQLAVKTAEQLANGSGRAKAMKLDVGDEVEAAAVLQKIQADFGGIDILINNAGVDRTTSIEEMTFEEWDRVICTNLRGPFVLCKLVFPIMRKQGGGHIVNIASTAAKRAWANASAYHASKYGLLGLSYALHVEGRKANIKVSGLVCGGMRTPFLLDRFPDIDVSTLQDPDNVAQSVIFLLTQPAETVIPEMMVLPMRETSWP